MSKKKAIFSFAALVSLACAMMPSPDISVTAETGQHNNRESSFTISSPQRLADISAYESVLKDYRFAILHQTDDVENIAGPINGSGFYHPDRTGYAFIDLDHDGTDELILGSIEQNQQFVIAYTISDQKPCPILDCPEWANYTVGKNGDIYFRSTGAESTVYARGTLAVSGSTSAGTVQTIGDCISNLEVTDIVYASGCFTDETETNYESFYQYYDNAADYLNRPPSEGCGHDYKDENALISQQQAETMIAAWTADRLPIPYTPFSALQDEFPQTLSPSQSRLTDLKQYQPILDLLHLTIREKDDTKLRGCGYGLHGSYTGHSSGLAEIGYTFLDLNHDGIDELITGSETPVNPENAQFYDVFTISDGEPVHVLRGTDLGDAGHPASIGKNGDLYPSYTGPLMGDGLPWHQRCTVNPAVPGYLDVQGYATGYTDEHGGFYYFEFEPETYFGGQTRDLYEKKYGEYRISRKKYNSILADWGTDKAEFAFTHFSKYLTEKETANSRIMGDVNSDGELNVTDVVLLQRWILAVQDTELACWENGDFCEDGVLDAFDLCLMKRELFKQTAVIS